MSIVRSLARVSYLPFVGFVSAYGAYNASLKILSDENAVWNDLDVEQALKQNFRCSFLVMLLMAIFFAFFRAGVVYYGRWDSVTRLSVRQTFCSDVRSGIENLLYKDLQATPKIFFRLCLTNDEDIQHSLKVNMFICQWHQRFIASVF